MAFPNVPVPKPVPDPAGPQPLTHARILYDNKLIGSTVSQPDAAVTLIPNTWERMLALDGVPITYLLPVALPLDSAGIAAHDLAGKNLKVEYSETEFGSFTTVHDSIIETDAAIFLLREDALTVARARFTVTGGDAEIGVVYAGLSLQMPRPIYGGHRPINLSAKTKYDNNTSDDGNFLGRNIVSQGLETGYSWKYLDDIWIREYFTPFRIAAQRVPFFISWRPADYPAEAAFGWTDADIAPENMGGGNKLMAVSFSLKAYGGR